MEENKASDIIANEFATYEDFLDSQIAAVDMYYLEDEDLARKLVELGFRGSGEVVKREEFEARKLAEQERMLKKSTVEPAASSGVDVSNDAFLSALAEREEPNRHGKMATVIYIRDFNSKNHEISGYIDYAHRLKSEDFVPYFKGEKKLLPRAADLSFYNWATQTSSSNDSPNFEVIADKYPPGLVFKNKRDRKNILVDPKLTDWGDNTTRTVIQTSQYVHVVFYDHVTRRKA